MAYAASASCLSSTASMRPRRGTSANQNVPVQPMLGVEVGPHSTVAVGLGWRDKDASGSFIMFVKAFAHGSAPELTLPAMKSSWALLTSTPGCWKWAGAHDSARGIGRGPGSAIGLATVEARLRAIARRESLGHIVAGCDQRERSKSKAGQRFGFYGPPIRLIAKLPYWNAEQYDGFHPAN